MGVARKATKVDRKKRKQIRGIRNGVTTHVSFLQPADFFFHTVLLYFAHMRILFWCRNKSIGNFCIFLWDLSLFACIFMLDF